MTNVCVEQPRLHIFFFLSGLESFFFPFYQSLQLLVLWELEILVTIKVFEFCQNPSFEWSHNLSFWILIIWASEFCYGGLLTPRGYGFFGDWKPCYENIFNIFSLTIFFILSEIWRITLWIIRFLTFHLMKTTTPGPYNDIFSTLYTLTVTQVKWP